MIAIILLWLLYILFAFYVLLNHAPSCRLTEEGLQAGRELQRVTFIESCLLEKRSPEDR